MHIRMCYIVTIKPLTYELIFLMAVSNIFLQDTYGMETIRKRRKNKSVIEEVGQQLKVTFAKSPPQSAECIAHLLYGRLCAVICRGFKSMIPSSLSSIV